MTLLHVYFNIHNQQAFQRLLERDRSAHSGPATPSTSGSKSWSRKNLALALEVNAFDHLGRTVLHLACSSIGAASLEYTRLLLAHPSINVNLPDKENHWTALHRALYAGNIEAAIILLKRPDTDISIKDMEGYTAFDLYNSTVRSANPSSLEDGHLDLFTWGANRNAALGLGDGNDRAHPDHVVLLKKDALLPATLTVEERFTPVKVREVSMSKLHTVILTDEPRDNVRLCGFGSGGRLGPFSHTLYTPTPLSLSSYTITSLALGQDHTLALTSAGEVISWGLNRFSQLGYVVEAGQGGSVDGSMQTVPRRISHLKKEFVKGVAACKTASACWSESDVWTWGVNNGQLGYSKTTSSVQVLPRKVSIITQPVRGIAMSESAMICLFVSGEVACIWNSGVSKINFPAHAFPSDISAVYRPPQAMRGPAITKLASCDDSFAALSSNGEVFTFYSPVLTEGEGNTPGGGVVGSKGHLIKPQRAWALRKQFSSVRDVDVGGDGTLIVCTQSGHIFVRSRNPKASITSAGSKAHKFQRVTHIQRAIAVCANSTGAFGALRVDYKPPPIHVTGKHFSSDIAGIAPYLRNDRTTTADELANVGLNAIMGADDDIEDSSILDDVGDTAKLLDVLHNQRLQWSNPTPMDISHGADLIVRVGPNFETLAHRLILATRCTPLQPVLGGTAVLLDKYSEISVTFSPETLGVSPFMTPLLYVTGIAPLTFLILLHYVYSDELLAIWDRRIGSLFEGSFSSFGVSPAQVKMELAALARILELPRLTWALQYLGKCAPQPSACDDFRRLFDQAQLLGPSRRNIRDDPLAPDVALHLADIIVYTHSVVLRARCPFFSAFFGDTDWTIRRKDNSGVVDIDMGHHQWRVMQFVLRFVCFGQEHLFETFESLNTVDEVIDFMFLVISAANELLLTRLVLLCSQVILGHLTTYNACYLLTEAIHFNALDLAERIERYMTANIEMLLESGILDDLDPMVVRKLSQHTRVEQAEKSPLSRLDKLGLEALEKHKDWLALQDIPMPIIPSQKALQTHRDAPGISPPGSAKKSARPLTLYSPATSPLLCPTSSSMPRPVLRSKPSGDEIFAMDDTEAVPALELDVSQPPVQVDIPAKATTVWKKNPSMPCTDLKSIMVEAETSKKQTSSIPGASKAPESPSPSRQIGSRWKLDKPPTPRRIPSDLAMQTISAETSRLTGSPAKAPSNLPLLQVSAPAPRAGTSQPSMGSVITPVRQIAAAPRSSTPRKTSAAWTIPPVQPIAEPSVPDLARSFAEIQRMQQIQGASAPKDKRSLREIQEEEQARQQEADFLKWWEAEEERVRLETLQQEQLLSQVSQASTSHSNKKSRPKPRKVKADGQPNNPSGPSQQRDPRGNRKPSHGSMV
ncbi:hypothetical protein BDN67DRAFT_905719 [Paxillus ammoniavirescens]|nr:hypothetical protein BDN67DRAFT_905719 [Paxillus ammoniavirescens]